MIYLRLLMILRDIYIYYRYIFRDFEWLWMKHFDPTCDWQYIYIYMHIYVYNDICSSTVRTQYANMEHITLQMLHSQYNWFICFYYIYIICIILYHIYGWFKFHIIYIHDTISCWFISHKP